MNHDEIRDIDIDQYYYDEVPAYIEIDNELTDIEAHLLEQKPLLQYGPPGTGKTRSFAHYGAANDIPIIHFDCSKDAKKADFILRPWVDIKNGERKTVYIPGALPLGIIAANEVGEAIIVLEEINSLTQYLQKNLLQMGDWRKRIHVPEANYTFTINDDARLLIGATMNPPDITSGVFDLNQELKDRFNELPREYPGRHKLAEILRENGAPDQIDTMSGIIEDQLVPFINSVNSLVSNDRNFDQALTPRHAVWLGRMWRRYYQMLDQRDDPGLNPVNEGLRRALRTTILGKYRDETQRQMIQDQIEQAFPVTVSV